MMDKKEKKDKQDLIDHLIGRGYKGDSSWHRYCLVDGCKNPSTGYLCFLHWRQLNKKDQRRLKIAPDKKLTDGHIIAIRSVLKQAYFSPVYQLPIVENHKKPK